MDTTKPPAFSCSPAELSAQLSRRDAPLLIDSRKNAAFLASTYTLPGDLRRDPVRLSEWADALPTTAQVVVFCAHGHEVGQNCMAGLLERGLAARFLQGGIDAWREQGLPLCSKAPDHATRWVTRETATAWTWRQPAPACWRYRSAWCRDAVAGQDEKHSGADA